VACTPPEDQYKKGPLFLNTLRGVINDDATWFSLLHDYYQHFKYQTIMSTDVDAFFSQRVGMNLTPIFNEYLHHATPPTLELRFDDVNHTVSYWWQAEEAAFAMPIRVGDPDHWQVIKPVTNAWKTMPTTLTRDQFSVVRICIMFSSRRPRGMSFSAAAEVAGRRAASSGAVREWVVESDYRLAPFARAVMT